MYVPHVDRSNRNSFGNSRQNRSTDASRVKRGIKRGQVAQVVERSPEKAGVGGSTPSLATIFSTTATYTYDAENHLLTTAGFVVCTSHYTGGGPAFRCFCDGCGRVAQPFAGLCEGWGSSFLTSILILLF